MARNVQVHLKLVNVPAFTIVVSKFVVVELETVVSMLMIDLSMGRLAPCRRPNVLRRLLIAVGGYWQIGVQR